MVVNLAQLIRILNEINGKQKNKIKKLKQGPFINKIESLDFRYRWQPSTMRNHSPTKPALGIFILHHDGVSWHHGIVHHGYIFKGVNSRVDSLEALNIVWADQHIVFETNAA